MSQPVKKPEITPESYSPKNKPEILRMAAEVIENSTPQRDLTFHMASFAYLNLPALRFIGVDAMTRGEDWGALWQRKREFLPALEQMKEAVSFELPYLCGFQHSANGDVNVEDHLIVGYFFREGTPVPDGYDFLDFTP